MNAAKVFPIAANGVRQRSEKRLTFGLWQSLENVLSNAQNCNGQTKPFKSWCWIGGMCQAPDKASLASLGVPIRAFNQCIGGDVCGNLFAQYVGVFREHGSVLFGHGDLLSFSEGIPQFRVFKRQRNDGCFKWRDLRYWNICGCKKSVPVIDQNFCGLLLPI